jgi:hypothetical protein
MVFKLKGRKYVFASIHKVNLSYLVYNSFYYYNYNIKLYKNK